MPVKKSLVRNVDDGRLFELEKTFQEILPFAVEPHGNLPVGSVVLVGSLPHVGPLWIGKLRWRVLVLLSAMVGEGVSVVPHVPIAATVQALFDLDS
jgi:hypothetical protein